MHALRISPALLLFAALPAAAQDVRPLSLAEAISIAEQRNPSYQRTLAQIEVSAAEVRARRGAYLPELALSMSTGGSLWRRATGEDPFGRPTRLDDPVTFRSSSASQSISLGQVTLYDGGRRRHELSAARADAAAVEAAAAAERARLEAEVSRRYRAVQLAERLLGLEREGLRLAEERLDAARRLLGLAIGSPLDVVGAEVAEAEQAQQVERARGSLRTATLALREEMGWMEGGPLHLTEPLPEPFDPAALELERLLAGALAGSPALLRREAERVAQERRLRSTGAARLPRISASAGYSRSLSSQEFHALFEPNPLDQSLSFGFQLQLPIFQQFRGEAERARARAQLGAAEHELAAERLAVERGVRGALVELENAYHAHRLAERVLLLNRDRVEMAEQRYRLGALDFRELQDVIERADDAARGLLSTRFDFVVALIALAERTGTVPR